MIYRSKSGGVKRWAKMLTTAVLAFVLAIVVFASTAFAGLLNEYNVDIVVDGVTTTVTTRVMTAAGSRMGRSTCQEVISPTPAGINIIGMISSKNRAVSCTWCSLRTPVASSRNISTRP